MSDESKEIGRIGFDSSGEPVIREPIIIKLSSYRNSKFIDIRKYYEADNDWKPTKKGVTLTGEQLNEFQKMLKDNENDINNWFKEE
jgi:hypothetical protein